MFGLSVADIFKTTPTTPAVQQQPAAGNTTAAALDNAGKTMTPGNGTVPAAATEGDKGPKSPLDEIADFWQTDPKSKQTPQKLFENLDPAKILEATGTMDFKALITPELQSKLKAGGDDAQNAMIDIMQKMAQHSTGNSTLNTAGIVEEALKKQEAMFLKKLPDILKRHGVQNSLAAENPVFSSPATKPIADLLLKQAQVRYPKATEAELKEQVTKFVSAFANTVKPGEIVKEASATGGNKEQDWSKFLTGNKN